MNSMRQLLLRTACVTALALAALSFGQTTLTVEEALKLARERNGDVRAAALNADAAKERRRQAFASFFPTITPNYTYTSQRQSANLGNGTSFFQTEGGSLGANLQWLVLDSGERQFTFLANRRSEDSNYFTAVQTLRQTLFNVYKQYISTLAAQESRKVSDVQVERAVKILEQTEARVKSGDAAGKDTLQARADALNAQVTALTAKQAVTTSLATLKGTIGWGSDQPMPTLAEVGEPSEEEPPSLQSLLLQAVQNRPDLRASRLGIDSLRYTKLRLDRDAGPTFTLNASWDQAFTPSMQENRTVTFTVSAPLFDGGLTRAQAREAKYNLLSAEASYAQQERSAKADVESAYYQVVQNIERLKAARAALEAARLNYTSALEAQRLGAENIIDVLTARVSLATAENNEIGAKYDTLTSQVQLALLTGRPIPGAPEA